VFVIMRDQYVTTIELCEEVGMSRSTLDRLRKAGVLLPGVHNYRLHGRRSALFWRVDAVIETLRCRSIVRETK
tara:strand:+ start:218 stop:436 length:219 start_codon:yes stop_codon:yes gene_type:complete